MKPKHIFITITAAIITNFLPLSLWAHANHETAMGMGVVSKEYLASPIAILKGVGTYQNLEVVSSLPAGPEKDKAEAYTRQGIALHHAFQWEDSVRSFNEALRIDPNMARAYAGLVTSYLNLVGPNDSLDFVADLMTEAGLAAELTQNNEIDRLWVDALSVTYSAQYNVSFTVPAVSQIGKTLTGKDANTKITTLFGELTNVRRDPEAFAFVGWTLQSYNFLDIGLQLYPTHSGLLHYLTHVNENTGKYQIAGDYAKTLVGIAPDAPHLLHMYGHVLPLLGRWAEANVYFLKAHCIHKAVLRLQDSDCANQVFEAPMSDVTPSSTELWHYAHNLDLYGFSLMRVRDLAKAEKIFKDLCDVGNCTTLIQFYQGEEMYTQAVSFIDQSMKSLNPTGQALYNNLKVQVLIGQNQVAAAQQLYQTVGAVSGIEGFATQLSLSWASKTPLSSATKASFSGWLAQSTTNPNFDVWSHTLPVLRKLYKIAKMYGAAEQQDLYDAIQKIDKGHPL